jgi:glucose dehydrogenase
VFIGGTMDEKFHAYDKSTGKLLWEYKLDTGGYATPCTYSVNGRQYLVIQVFFPAPHAPVGHHLGMKMPSLHTLHSYTLQAFSHQGV